MTVVDLYTIQIMCSDEARPYGFAISPSMVNGIMAEMEENLTDLLPAGYRARIRRWDDITDEGEAWETQPTTPTDEQTKKERTQ